MTAEHAHGIDTGGEVEALAEAICAARHPHEQAEIERVPESTNPRFRAAAHFGCYSIAEEMGADWLANHDATTRASAAVAVLAEARQLCCGNNPSAHHAASAKHSALMAFAGDLARAVRGL